MQLKLSHLGTPSFSAHLERPKSFLVPVSDYEILELKETRMVLKNVSTERSIKIGGGREAAPPGLTGKAQPLKPERKAVPLAKTRSAMPSAPQISAATNVQNNVRTSAPNLKTENGTTNAAAAVAEAAIETGMNRILKKCANALQKSINRLTSPLRTFLKKP